MLNHPSGAHADAVATPNRNAHAAADTDPDPDAHAHAAPDADANPYTNSPNTHADPNRDFGRSIICRDDRH
ncbi:MAG: hypothetical protein ABR949_15610 [Candidatus Aquilonibacter sp.]|jgi:hypothetical protein